MDAAVAVVNGLTCAAVVVAVVVADGLAQHFQLTHGIRIVPTQPLIGDLVVFRRIYQDAYSYPISAANNRWVGVGYRTLSVHAALAMEEIVVMTSPVATRGIAPLWSDRTHCWYAFPSSALAAGSTIGVAMFVPPITTCVLRVAMSLAISNWSLS